MLAGRECQFRRRRTHPSNVRSLLKGARTHLLSLSSVKSTIRARWSELMPGPTRWLITATPSLTRQLSRGMRLCHRPQRGQRSDSRGRRADLPKSVQAAAPPPKTPALAQACRKRRPRSPRSPALGRTHNDGAPVLKLGQGLFSEIATFTLESGPTSLVPARFVAPVSRDGAP